MTNTNKSNRPFVFVRCLTYNHEKYIEDALKGFVMQKTDFPFVVVIVNDASPDGTKEVIRNFLLEHCSKESLSEEKTEYATIIHAINKDNVNCELVVYNLYQNHYGKKPQRQYYQAFVDKATYWAECEGDDYWTDPYKLQKQVDFMETHPDYVACCHNAIVASEGNRRLFNSLNESNYPTTQEIIERDWFIPTASMVYRHKIVKYPSWSTQIVNSDYLLVLLLAQQGKIYYMQDVMSVYRRHQGGMSYSIQQNIIKFNEGLIQLMKNTKELYGGEHSDSFDKAIGKYQTRKKEAEREMKYPWLKYLYRRTYKRMIKQWLRRYI